jgi:hypothetical protein
VRVIRVAYGSAHRRGGRKKCVHPLRDAAHAASTQHNAQGFESFLRLDRVGIGGFRGRHSGESDQLRVAQHGEQQHLSSGGHIVLGGALCLVVADAAFTGNEDHARGSYSVDVAGVVTRA